MKYDPNKHHRRSIRLKEYDYSQAGVYFITICTKNRECLFGRVVNGLMELSPFGVIAHQFWFEIPKHFDNVELDEFNAMPNHIHGIIEITSDNQIAYNVGAIRELPLPKLPIHVQRRKMLIPRIVGYYKMNTAKRINQMRNTPGIPVWQRNYYEHIIRNEDDLNKIRRYIINNPIKWESDRENPKKIKQG
ncbi:transposase [candidate division KSB1 bacterium]|nr:transposase [candidate division KSB1 bacterium]